MYVSIQTVDGQFFSSDAVDMVDSGLGVQEWATEMDNVRGLFQDWRNMNYVGLEIGGKTKYFNPANVVWAELVE